jgi:hypothetical protein
MGFGECHKPHSLLSTNVLFSSKSIWDYQDVNLLALTQDLSEKEYILGLIKQKVSIMSKTENKKCSQQNKA